MAVNTESEPFEGPLSRDLHVVRRGPAVSYEKRPNGPITFGSVLLDGRTIGFVYCSDAHGALGFVAAASAGDFGLNAAGSWSRLFRFQFQRELRPSQAFAEIAQGESGSETVGSLSTESIHDLPTFDALDGLARSS